MSAKPQALLDANVDPQSVVIASCARAELALLRSDPAARGTSSPRRAARSRTAIS